MRYKSLEYFFITKQQFFKNNRYFVILSDTIVEKQTTEDTIVEKQTTEDTIVEKQTTEVTTVEEVTTESNPCFENPCGESICKPLENTFICSCQDNTQWFNYSSNACEEVDFDNCTFIFCKESEECKSGECIIINNCKEDSCKHTNNSKCEENHENPEIPKCTCNEGFIKFEENCFEETKCEENIAETTYCFIDGEKNVGTVCKEGYTNNTGIGCIEPCTQEEKDKCYTNGADCVNTYDNDEAKPSCQCKPLYYDNDAKCESGKSYTTTLTLLNKYNVGAKALRSLKQHSNSLSNTQNKYLQNDITDALIGVYGKDFKRALIENCISNGEKIVCNILLMFQTDQHPDRLKSNHTCLSPHVNGEEFCLIPPKLAVEKKSLQNAEFSEIFNNCSYGSFCTPPNICELVNDKFYCKCQKGYLSVHVKDYSNVGKEDICVDVNECTDKNLNKCGDNTICTNLPGEYKCDCKENFKPLKNNDKECIGMCDDNPCEGRGECELLKNDFFCKCKEGYSGRLCDTQDEILKNAKMKTIIVGAILGSILLLIIIIAGVSICKLKNQKKVHNDEHCLEEMSSRKRDRSQEGAAYDNPVMKRN
ncbi:uncharacterized protein LOC143236486 [Tachypleus tridentatus]|uniref:uncharacterized protein LOC143236486 n=1 Tax=Tachypleus tridentatus TaxID=6853 RepID=UPI003FD18D36